MKTLKELRDCNTNLAIRYRKIRIHPQLLATSMQEEIHWLCRERLPIHRHRNRMEIVPREPYRGSESPLCSSYSIAVLFGLSTGTPGSNDACEQGEMKWVTVRMNPLSRAAEAPLQLSLRTFPKCCIGASSRTATWTALFSP